MEQQAEVNKRRAIELAEQERLAIQRAQEEALKVQATQPDQKIPDTTDMTSVQMSVEEVKS